MFYRGHPAGDSIVRALCKEYLDSAGDDVTQLTKALVEMYGDLLSLLRQFHRHCIIQVSISSYQFRYIIN